MQLPPASAILCITVLAAPAASQGSDDCNSAQAITGEGLFAVDCSAATQDGPLDCLEIHDDVWFAWTAPTSDTYLFETCGLLAWDSALAIYAGMGCPPGPSLDCNDDTCSLQSQVVANVTAGSTYLVRVGSFAEGQGDVGQLNVVRLVLPPNDDCANAAPIAGEGVFDFDTSSATTDGGLDCLQIYDDIWFAWTAPATETYRVETCGLLGWDSALALYDDAGCPPGSSLDCNDDSCGLQSLVFVNASAGASYLIRVGSFAAGGGGVGQFRISEGGPGWDCENPPVGPDVIVGNITSILGWGTVGTKSAYSFGATACNVGDSEMPWEGPTNRHPLIAPNLYRLEAGRIEQIGLGWIKHGFGSATENYCCACQAPGDNQIMGIGCADTYSASINGDQDGFDWGNGTIAGGLGPRSDVNPLTGVFPFPYTDAGQSGDAIYKRLQVELSDLDPSLHPSALYFAEVHYITQDDAAPGNGYNNASYRRAVVTGFSSGAWDLALTDQTEVPLPAVHAWRDQSPNVVLNTVDDPEGGRFTLASLATDNGDGTWDYEYALHNLNSNLAADGFSVPIEPGTSVNGVGFHDVDYHSGEAYDGTDWPGMVLAGRVEWATVGSDPLANALRWGTSYNFRFTADRPPVTAATTIELFGPGSNDSVQVDAVVPENDCGIVSYCEGAANSAGPGATLSASGSTSIAQNDLVLTSNGGVPNQFGLFFYGPTLQQIPFGDGFLCVGAPLFRLRPPLQADGFGETVRALDYTQPPMNAGAGMVTVGSVWNFQHWYRDPMGQGGSGFNTSDALSITFCP